MIGEFEKLVLLAILRLGDDAYGATVLEELESRLGRSVSDGAVYVSLRRLETKGLIAASTGDSSPERGGRPRRYLRVEPDGIAALRDSREAWDALAHGLDDLLGEAS
jgi:DNA-binding PadR family transcriptional regulator